MNQKIDPRLLKIAQDNLDKLPIDIQQKIGELVFHARKMGVQDKAQDDFMAFVNYVWPTFIHGRHHQRMARAFEKVARGECKRLIINMAPRHSKSEMASYLLPAWFLGKFPQKKIIQASYNAELATGFGRKVRNLVDSDKFKDVFPNVELRTDSKAAGRWNTNHNGDYFAIGVGGNMTGRGADICVSPGSIVYEQSRGAIEARCVKLGDKLLGSDGYGAVTCIHDSLHRGTVNVDGAKMSLNHPVWTANKGWVDAGLLTTDDLLQTINVYDKLSSFIKTGVNHASSNERAKKLFKIVFSCLQHLGTNATTMFQSKRNQLFQVWGERDNGLRTMEQVRSIRFGYGGAANPTAYTRQNGSKWGLLTGELPLGGYGDPVQQQTQQRKHNSVWENSNLGAVGEGGRSFEGYDKAQDIRDGVVTRGSVEYAERELGAETSVAVRLARELCPALRITRRYGEGYRIEQKIGSSVFSWKEQIVLRLLLGIRTPKSISIKSHEPEQFVNFTVQGHNTFIVNPYLSHNCIIDDPHSEQEAVLAESDPSVYDRTYEWYTSGPRQRLQPGGAIIIVATRWSTRDLCGQILKTAAQRTGEEWEVIELPAILPSDNPIWPEFWSKDELFALRRELPSSKWMAQYQQQPASDVAAIIKREWWKIWNKDDPPICEFIIQSWDTAFTKNERSDYSACTTWGIFYKEDDTGIHQANIILLDYFKKRMEFPELKQKTFEMWKEWEPDSIIIESKASGAPLVFELRAMGIPVQEFTPVRGGGDKIVRANAIADIFASGRVWAPNRHWAEELIEETASFPSGDHDDGVDATVMAMMRFRKGGFLRLPSDEDDEQQYFRRKVAYY